MFRSFQYCAVQAGAPRMCKNKQMFHKNAPPVIGFLLYLTPCRKRKQTGLPACEKRPVMDVSPSRKKTLILLITVLAPFTATLDASIVNVALPVLSRSLHTESSSVAWVSNIYTIVMAAAILFFGRLGDIRGQEKVFTGGMALFAAGSLLCSFASGFGELLAARMIQAAGGSAAWQTVRYYCADFSGFPERARTGAERCFCGPGHGRRPFGRRLASRL